MLSAEDHSKNAIHYSKSSFSFQSNFTKLPSRIALTVLQSKTLTFNHIIWEDCTFFSHKKVKPSLIDKQPRCKLNLWMVIFFLKNSSKELALSLLFKRNVKLLLLALVKNAGVNNLPIPPVFAGEKLLKNSSQRKITMD